MANFSFLDSTGLTTLWAKIKNTFVASSTKGVAGGVASLDNSGSVPTSQIPTLSISKIDGLQSALNNKLETSLKGAASGLAELDSGGKVPSSQLPSYVDDVLEYASKTNFPSTGEAGKIYVALDTNLTYRWGGTAYVEISPSLALGITSDTAYYGDKGKIAYDHSQSTHARTDATAVTVDGSTPNGSIKINGTATAVYTHPTDAGNKHIPSGGSANQFLKYSSSGTAVWADDPVLALDVNDISGFGAGKTLATLTETDGKIAATFQNISITHSQISDYPTTIGSHSLPVYFNNGTPTVIDSLSVSGDIISTGGGVVAFGIADLSMSPGGGSGTVTGITVDDTLYEPINGIIELPDYPTWSTLSGKPTFGDAAYKDTGTTSGTVATGDHNHLFSFSTTSGAANVTLSAGTKYQVKAGGSELIIRTPDDTWRDITDTYNPNGTASSSISLSQKGAQDMFYFIGQNVLTDIAWSSNKLTKTINGTTSDVVSISTIKTALALTKSDVGLGNVGNFKAVSTEANQGLTSAEQSNARANIGAGTSNLTIGTTASTAAAGNHTHTDFSGGLSVSYNESTPSPEGYVPFWVQNSNDYTRGSYIGFADDSHTMGIIGFASDGTPQIGFPDGSDGYTKYTIITSNNIGTAAGYNATSSVIQNSGDLVTSGGVWSAINALPTPMQFKGSVGTNGTITWANLPSASSSTGYTYKVITEHTSAPVCKVGDTIVSNGTDWVVIPSGDEPSGTVTSVGISVPTGLSVAGSPITSQGLIAISYASGYAIPTTAKQSNWDTAYSNSHTHSNKSVLDGITSTNVSNWGTAYTNSHTHSNKSVLDGITSTKVSNWDTAYGWGNHASAGYLLATTAASTYLPKTGGILYSSGNNFPLVIKTGESGSSGIAGIQFMDGNSTTFGSLYATKDTALYFSLSNQGGTNTYTVLHSGNSSVSLSGSTLTVKINGVEKSLTNTNTTYSAGTGLSLSGTTFNHSNSVTAQTTQALYPIKIDAQGHISSYGSAVTSLPASDVSSWAKASSLSIGLTTSSVSSYTQLQAATQYAFSAGGSTIYFCTPQDTNTWRPLGTGANDACAGNDSRLSDPRPASDVYSWAKASSKPSYAFSEITGTVTNAQLAGSIANSKLAHYTITISGEDVDLGGEISQSSLRNALGLGSAAYTASSAYATAGHTHSQYSLTSHTHQEFGNGTNKAPLSIWGKSGEGAFLRFDIPNEGVLGYIGFDTTYGPVLLGPDASSYVTLIHSGNIGDQSVDYADSAGSVAWTNVSGRPTNVSSFTNDSGYVTSSGSVNYATSAGSATTASNADTVDNEHASAFAHVGQWNNLLTAGNEFNFISNGFTGSVWINYQDGNRQSGANVDAYYFGDGRSNYNTTLYCGGVYKANYGSSSYVLTSDGGAAAISGLSVNYANSAGSAPANGGTSTCVQITYNDDTNSTYQMLWGSGNYVYGTSGIYCNPYTDYLYSGSFYCSNWFRSSGNTGWYNESYGTGLYSTDGSWLRSYNGAGIVAGGFYHSSYASSSYVLTSDGGAAAISGLSVSYASTAGSATYATSAGSATDSTKLPLSGGTLTGALRIETAQIATGNIPLTLKGQASSSYSAGCLINLIEPYRTAGGQYESYLGTITGTLVFTQGSTTYNVLHTGNISDNASTIKTGLSLTASDVGLGNVGNFKAVSTVASQGLTATEKSNARANIGAGTSSLTIGTTSSTAAAGNHTHSSFDSLFIGKNSDSADTPLSMDCADTQSVCQIRFGKANVGTLGWIGVANPSTDVYLPYFKGRNGTEPEVIVTESMTSSLEVYYASYAGSVAWGDITSKPGSYNPSSHTHGNIQNGGTLQSSDISIASGDKLVVTDSSDSSKIARTSLAFDGSTITQALTKKGTFENVQPALVGGSNSTGTTIGINFSGKPRVDFVSSGSSDAVGSLYITTGPSYTTIWGVWQYVCLYGFSGVQTPGTSTGWTIWPGNNVDIYPTSGSNEYFVMRYMFVKVNINNVETNVMIVEVGCGMYLD